MPYARCPPTHSFNRAISLPTPYAPRPRPAPPPPQVATKAKLRVLEAMPEVMDVTISLDAEQPSRPAGGSDFGGGGLVVGGKTYDVGRTHLDGELMSSRAEIEADVRRAIFGSGRAGLRAVSRTRLHWRSRDACSGAIVEAALVLEPSLSLEEAHALARAVRVAVLRAVPGVLDVDLHAELFDGGGGAELFAHVVDGGGGAAHGEMGSMADAAAGERAMGQRRAAAEEAAG